jgi:hypothetical protein
LNLIRVMPAKGQDHHAQFNVPDAGIGRASHVAWTTLGFSTASRSLRNFPPTGAIR